MASSETRPHRISVVIPVYQGERTLEAVVSELMTYAVPSQSPAGNWFEVGEIIPVYDHGPDRSDAAIRRVAEGNDLVKPVWLSRNYGQHPATIAGMSSAGGDWIVTMDEDGQHDPVFLGGMLDTAIEQRADVVYARPTNPAPHSAFRNLTSKLAKRIMAGVLATPQAPNYQSYRLVLGEVGRSLAAYAGPGVFLDIALGWISNRVATAPVVLRREGDRASGYNLRRLLSHFWRMVVSSGTRGLRLVSFLGALFAAVGVIWSIWLLVVRLTVPNSELVPGWTSMMILLLLATGAILFSLGVVAEYIGVNVNMAMGKPLYLIVSDPAHGPLGRDELVEPDTEG